MDNTPTQNNRGTRYFDIVPRSRTQPPPTSRPVIVNSEPARVDPMVRENPGTMTPPIANPVVTDVPKPDPTSLSQDSNSSEVSIPATPIVPTVVGVSINSEVDQPLGPSVSQPVVPAPDPIMHQVEPVSVTRRIARRLHALILIVLVLLLLVLVVDLVLDVGLIKPSVNIPHTHLFQNKQL